MSISTPLLRWKQELRAIEKIADPRARVAAYDVFRSQNPSYRDDIFNPAKSGGFFQFGDAVLRIGGPIIGGMATGTGPVGAAAIAGVMTVSMKTDAPTFSPGLSSPTAIAFSRNIEAARETPIATTPVSGLGLFSTNVDDPSKLQLGEIQANARKSKTNDSIFYIVGALVLIVILFFKRS